MKAAYSLGDCHGLSFFAACLKCLRMKSGCRVLLPGTKGIKSGFGSRAKLKHLKPIAIEEVVEGIYGSSEPKKKKSKFLDLHPVLKSPTSKVGSSQSSKFLECHMHTML
eukprot:1160955-Pelagomonas_calceolata.AAC.4